MSLHRRSLNTPAGVSEPAHPAVDGQLPHLCPLQSVPVPPGNLFRPRLDLLQLLPAPGLAQDLEQLLLHPAHILRRVALAGHHPPDLYLARVQPPEVAVVGP